MTWTDQAACVGHDPELWHAEGTTRQARDAQQQAAVICSTCPVQTACLMYAMDHEWNHTASRYGIWAGTTPAERQAMGKRASRGRKKVA